MENCTRYTVVLFAILIALLLLMPKGGEPNDYKSNSILSPPVPSPALSISPNPLHENETAEIRLDLPADCAYAAGQLSMDAKTLHASLGPGSLITVQVRVPMGSHLVSFESGACKAALQFDVLPQACPDGTTRACLDARGCNGIQSCRGGTWLSCRAPAPLCAPNTQVPCPLDGCHWGKATCDHCGSGWSTCR